MWLLLKNVFDADFIIDRRGLIELNKINNFVGKNNSGKSYFMRFLLKNVVCILTRSEINVLMCSKKDICNKETLLKLFDFNIFSSNFSSMKKLLDQMQDLKKEAVATGSEWAYGKHAGTVYKFKDIEKVKNENYELTQIILEYENKIDEYFASIIMNEEEEISKIIYDKMFEVVVQEISSVSNEKIYLLGEIIRMHSNVQIKLKEHDEKLAGALTTHKCNKYYIPLMRNIRHPLKNPNEKDNVYDNDIYKERVVLEYGFNKNDVNVITGLNFYQSYKENLLGSKLERDKTSDFENFLSQYFFEGKNVSIIPDEKTFEIKINIDDSDDLSIYQVGDGINALIILLYQVFLCDKDKSNIFFIEEPEINFHPGFQRLLINIISLSNKFKNCYFFFTTHSNHILDISQEEMKNVDNYICKKENNKIKIDIKSDEFYDLLEELGVSASSVQLANAIIWVEGKYDAKTIRLLLNIKQMNSSAKVLMEGYDFAFVPFGGSNGTLINYIRGRAVVDDNFILNARAINNKFVLIIDSDNIGESKNKKTERYEYLKEEMGNKLYKLECREIENIFPEDVVRNFVKNNIKKEYCDSNFINEINYESYKKEKLGSYINKLIKKEFPDVELAIITGRVNGFEKNGFLYNKEKFHDEVIKWVQSVDFDFDRDITDEAKELIEYIENNIV